MKKFIKYGIIAGGALILAGAGITTASLLLGADMGDLNGHIRKRLHHLDELDGIVEREVDPEEYLVRVDQDPAPEGWETARVEGQDPEAGPSAEPFAGGEPCSPREQTEALRPGIQRSRILRSGSRAGAWRSSGWMRSAP